MRPAVFPAAAAVLTVDGYAAPAIRQNVEPLIGLDRHARVNTADEQDEHANLWGQVTRGPNRPKTKQ